MALAHVQDIYADDIGFNISMEALGAGRMREFYENWVKVPDANSQDKIQALATISSNAFALGTLRRRNITDSNVELTIKKKSDLFLKTAFPNASLEKLEDLYERSADYFATLRTFTDGQSERFAREMNRYFDLIISARAFW